MRGLLSTGVQVVATRLVGAALGVLVAAVLGRALGPERFGAYSYLLMVLTLLAVPISNGWSTMLLREVAAADDEPRMAIAKGMLVRGSQAAAMYSVAVALAGTVVLEIVGHSAGPLALSGLPIWVGLVLVSFFDQVSALRAGVLRGLNHPALGQAPEMIVRPLVLVVAFMVINATVGSAAPLGHAVAALVLAAIIAALAGFWMLRTTVPAALLQAKATYQTARWCWTSVLLTGNAALVLFNTYLDTLLLGVLGTLADVGIYRVAMLTSLVSGFAYTAFNIVAAQRFSQLNSRSDIGELQATAVYMARVAVLGALPVPIIFWLYGQELVAYAFGPAFMGALLLMAPLFVSQLLNATFGMSRNLLVMSGNEVSAFKSTLVAVAVNALVSIVLIPRMGALGAAYASAGSAILWNAMMWYQARRLTGVDTSVLNLKRSGTDMKSLLKRFGGRIVGRRHRQVCNLAIDEPGALIEATYWAEPALLRMHLPVAWLRMQGGYVYGPGHPFAIALRDGSAALTSFYASTRPVSLGEWYGLSRSQGLGCDLPPWELPWYKRDGREPLSGEGHLDASHGVSFHGPASSDKVAYEMRRLIQVRDSIAASGYRPEVYGDIEGYVLSAGGQACFFVRGGKHRAAALCHLGYATIPVTFRASLPRLVDESMAAHWPLVREGKMSVAVAQELLRRYTHPPAPGGAT